MPSVVVGPTNGVGPVVEHTGGVPSTPSPAPPMRIVNDQLRADLDAGRPVSLAIGAGHEQDSGHYTLDLRELPTVDVVADLNEPLADLPDHCVESVHAHHVLEHVRELDALMDELHRVLLPSGRLQVIVPHWANPLGHSDPTHVRLFGLYSFGYFTDVERQPLGRKVPCYRSAHRFDVESLELGFRPRARWSRWLEAQLNQRPAALEFYERNLARGWWPYEIRCTLTPSPDA